MSNLCRPHFRKCHLWPATSLALLLLLGWLVSPAGANLTRQNGSTWPAPTYDPDSAQAARQLLDEILSRPGYQWTDAQPGPLARLWEQFLNFLFRQLSGLSAPGSPILTYGLTLLGIIALLIVLAYAARSLLGNFTTTIDPQTEASDTPDLTASAAARQAETLSQGGDYRTAVRYLYLASLLTLDERGILRYDRTRTNREYLRTVDNQPELAARLRQVVEVFDQVWYGYQPLDEAAYARYAAQVARLRQQG